MGEIFPPHNAIFLLCGGMAVRNLVKGSCQSYHDGPISCHDGYDDERDKGGHRRTEGGVGQRGLASQVRASTLPPPPTTFPNARGSLSILAPTRPTAHQAHLLTKKE